MRAMTWCLGVVMIIMWHSLLIAHGVRADWSWFAALFLWFFAGVGALIMSVVRLIAGKVKGGVPSVTGGRQLGAPPTQKGE